MKKILTLLATLTLAVVLGACGGGEAEEPAAETPAAEEAATEEPAEEPSEEPAEEASAETIKLMVTNGVDEQIEVDFPFDPQRIVVLNYQTLDFLIAAGLEDRIVGTIGDPTMSEHLKHVWEDPDVQQLGGMKDYDLEAIMSLQPDVIFSSDRSADAYDTFIQIAPTFAAYVDYSIGFWNSYKELAGKHAAIFGVGAEFDEVIAGYEARLEAINTFAEGKTALLGLVTGQEYNALGNGGRASIIMDGADPDGDEIGMGFTNLDGDEDINHGDIASMDLILELNPDYLFVLDKDTAVGDETPITAEQLMDNDIIAQTTAAQNGNIVYLTPGSNWYLCDGGILAMDAMIACIEEGIGL